MATLMRWPLLESMAQRQRASIGISCDYVGAYEVGGGWELQDDRVRFNRDVLHQGCVRDHIDPKTLISIIIKP